MGQCVTVNVGNSGAVTNPGEGSSGTNVNVGAAPDEEEEEEDEEGFCSCVEESACASCI